MKKCLSLLCLFTLATTFAADHPHITNPADLASDELSMLDHLIGATEQSLQNERQLRQLIINYQELQEKYLHNTQDTEQLFQLVKTAHHVLNNIEENHLTHLFSSEFINELKLLSQIAKKRGVPKP